MLKKLERFSLPEVEEKVLKFWQENQIFEKSLAKNRPKNPKLKSKKTFVFYEGPPTANGRPGIHHVLARSFKDIILRYKTMAGFFVPRRGGWDTHGLPVEIEVEKELGLKSKKDIEKYGIAEFNKKCKESVWKYKDEWEKLTRRIGFWLDLENPYITYENSYIEVLWSILKKAWSKKLLYKGRKVVPWCPRCGTALSSHELAQGYEEVEDTSVYVKFRITNFKPKIKSKLQIPKNKAVFILSWTTTPWTLPGNVALAVNPKLTYVIAQYKEVRSPKINRNIRRSNLPEVERFVLAKEKLSVLGENYEIIKELKGEDLIGLEYEPLFEIKSLQNKNSHKIYAADFVNTEEGTGVVHTAVMYGEDDYNLGKKVGLPQHHTVDESGKFTKEVPGLGGLYVKDKKTEEKIINYLKAKNYLLKTEKYKHDYPFCWRCETPLIYYARDSWFIAMSKLRNKLLAANQKINWIPEHIKNGRFGEWLREVKDWALTRERYWATPLPVWECEKCGQQEVLGGIDELEKRLGKSTNRYILVRHGEAQSNLNHKMSGWPEKEKAHLTLFGRLEVEKLAKKLAKEKVDYIYASDLTRTKETGKILADVLKGEKVHFDPRLREINTGRFNGCHDSEYHAYFTSTIEKFTKAPPGGESLTDLRKRLFEFVSELERKYRHKTIVIVSHEYPIWMLWQLMTGASNEEAVSEKERRGDYFIETGGAEELTMRRLPRDETGLLDLHRPYVDEVRFPCAKPRCNGEMKRVKEVIDAWFDSGAMPFASGASFPADYIAEGVDQTRGWFYTLLAVGVLLDKGRPYKNVISLGHVLDKNGQKMSKSKGNVVDPWQIAGKYGADAIRWYFYTVNPPGEPKRFDEADIPKGAGQFISLLYNSFSFLNTYDTGVHKIPKFPPQTAALNVLDKWIIARLHQTIDLSTKKLNDYDIGGAAREIENFVGDLSRWYIRRSRPRFQKPESKKDYQAALATLNHVLLETSKLIAPFVPFFAEAFYKSLNQESGVGNKNSVHLEDWPKANKKLIDKKLLGEMATIRLLSSLALAKRAEAGIKIRQPLSLLKIAREQFSGKLGKGKGRFVLLKLLKDEVNVKEIIFDEKLKEGIELDTEITHELKEEGWLREFIRLTQDLRKDAGLKPKDRIVLLVELPDELRYVVGKNEKSVKEKLGVKTIEYRRLEKFDAELKTKIDEWPVWIAFRRPL